MLKCHKPQEQNQVEVVGTEVVVVHSLEETKTEKEVVAEAEIEKEENLLEGHHQEEKVVKVAEGIRVLLKEDLMLLQKEKEEIKRSFSLQQNPLDKKAQNKPHLQNHYFEIYSKTKHPYQLLTDKSL